MKSKRIIAIVIIAVILAIALPIESIAKSFDLNIKFDGKNISMESETTDMSWNLNNLLPGQSDTSSVTIKNSGSGPVVLETEISIEEDTGLLEMIDLKVTNKKGEEVYTGKYTEMETIETPLGIGDTETFTVETSLNVNAGNEYQNKQYKLKFNFNATGTDLYGTLTVRHVDENGNDIEPPTVDTKNINDTYDYTNENPKDLSYLGYEYSGTVTTTRADGKLSGNYEINGTEIVYHYDRVGKVSVKWVVDDEIDEATGKSKVLRSFEDIKKVGTDYSFEAENYENLGYKYTEKVDGEPSGNYGQDPIDIVFHYEKMKYGKLSVKWIVDNEIDEKTGEKKVLESYSDIQEVGKPYSYSAKNFFGYTYNGKTEGNPSSTYSEDDINIVFHYTKTSHEQPPHKESGKVIVIYVDENETEIARDEDIGEVGKSYSYTEDEIKKNVPSGYKYIETVGDLTGEYKKDDTVIYCKCEAIKPGKVIILYVDENGKEISRQEDTGVVGDSYSYTEDKVIKTIPGYKFIAIEGSLTGEYKKEDTIIYCKYESIKNGNLIVVCIDENNNIIKRTVTTKEIGTDYDLGKVGEEIPGYEFLGVDGDTVGKYKEEDTIVTYRYKSIKQGPSTNVVSKPKTGDEIIKYIAIVAGAVIVLLIVVVIMKKKNKDNK